MEIDITKELTRSIISVVRHKEFYGHVVQQFQKVFVEGNHFVETAAVGRMKGERFVKLFYNRDYFKQLYEESFNKIGDERKALVEGRLLASGATEHEILHVVFGHLGMVYSDVTRGGVAMDLVVNPCIPKERRHESWLMPDMYGLPEGKNSKWYYEKLKSNKKYQDDCRSGVFGAGGFLSWVIGSHSMWGDIQKDSIVKEILKDIVRKARENTSSDGWSGLSDKIREKIECFIETTAPKVPWARVFRNFCGSSERSVLEYTMSRTSRRFGTRPGTRIRDMLSVGVIIDTSASISDDDLKLFFNEVRWIWRGGVTVRIFEADTSIKNDYDFNGRFTGEVSGRTGTNLEVPIMSVDAMRRYDCIVYFTDFVAARIRRKPRTPVLWVLSNPPKEEMWPCDWGRAVIIE